MAASDQGKAERNETSLWRPSGTVPKSRSGTAQWLCKVVFRCSKETYGFCYTKEACGFCCMKGRCDERGYGILHGLADYIYPLEVEAIERIFIIRPAPSLRGLWNVHSPYYKRDFRRSVQHLLQKIKGCGVRYQIREMSTSTRKTIRKEMRDTHPLLHCSLDSWKMEMFANRDAF